MNILSSDLAPRLNHSSFLWAPKFPTPTYTILTLQTYFLLTSNLCRSSNPLWFTCEKENLTALGRFKFMQPALKTQSAFIATWIKFLYRTELFLRTVNVNNINFLKKAQYSKERNWVIVVFQM